MAKNSIAERHSLQVAAPAGGVSAGDFVVVGAIRGVAKTAAAAGEPVVLATEGVFTLPKAADIITTGDKLYWNAAAKNFTVTAAGNIFAAIATADASSGAATVRALIDLCL